MRKKEMMATQRIATTSTIVLRTMFLFNLSKGTLLALLHRIHLGKRIDTRCTYAWLSFTSSEERSPL